VPVCWYFSLSLKGEGRGEGMAVHEQAVLTQTGDALTLTLSLKGEGTSPG
jgi:hypothetical protein